jgi:CRP-like cAMP-binding protein
MFDQLLEKIPRLKKHWNKYQRLFTEIHIPAKATLLKEGEVPRKIFFVKKGCLRASFNNRGKDVTFQFFFENDAVASIESFRTNQLSPISIKSIEPSTIIVLHKSGFETLLRDFPELKDLMLEMAFRRFSQYSRLFLSYIKNNPRQRYLELLKEKPEIVQRVPQRYIASYLGITPVSLSRIRKRI